MTKGDPRLVSSRAVNGTVPPRRAPNAELRTREYLDEFESDDSLKRAFSHVKSPSVLFECLNIAPYWDSASLIDESL